MNTVKPLWERIKLKEVLKTGESNNSHKNYCSRKFQTVLVYSPVFDFSSKIRVRLRNKLAIEIFLPEIRYLKPQQFKMSCDY